MDNHVSITISFDLYNEVREKAIKYDMIVNALKANIDRNEIYPVKEDEILLLTELTEYMHKHVQAMANKIGSKIMEEALKETLSNELTEETNDGENQAEL